MGRCVNAYGTLYAVIVSSGAVPGRDPNGETWDAGGGAPDLYVVVQHAGQSCRTPTVEDEFEPLWFHRCEFVIQRGEEFRWDLWDEDWGEDDWGGAWAFENGIPVEILRGGAIWGQSEDGRTRVELTLWPTE